MTALRLAIVGLGRWGVHLLRNFLALPGAEVIAVVDPNPAALAQVQERFSLPEPVQCLSHWQTAFALPDLQGVAIATPAATHYPLIKAALESRLHVLTEKPMTLDVGECQELCDLAARHHCQLVVDHTYLFHPTVEAGKQVIQKERLGKLRYGYASRTHLGPVRNDVDALWDLAIHDIAIFNTWLGETPAQVAAWGTAWLQPEPHPLFSKGLADRVWARLTYPSGFESVLHVSWLNPDKQRRLAVVGEQGTLVFDELAETPLMLYQGAIAAEPPYLPTGLTAVPVDTAKTEPLAQVCHHFLDCVKHQVRSPISSGAIATPLVQTLVALSQSLHSGQPVSVPAISLRGQA